MGAGKGKTQPQGGSSTQQALFGQLFGRISRPWEVPLYESPSRGCGKKWRWGHILEGEEGKGTPRGAGNPEELVCLDDVRELQGQQRLGSFRALELYLNHRDQMWGLTFSLVPVGFELVVLACHEKISNMETRAIFGSLISHHGTSNFILKRIRSLPVVCKKIWMFPWENIQRTGANRSVKKKIYLVIYYRRRNVQPSLLKTYESKQLLCCSNVTLAKIISSWKTLDPLSCLIASVFWEVS